MERAVREELRYVRPGEVVYRLDDTSGGSSSAAGSARP
jgi:cell division protein FtsB